MGKFKQYIEESNSIESHRWVQGVLGSVERSGANLAHIHTVQKGNHYHVTVADPNSEAAVHRHVSSWMHYIGNDAYGNRHYANVDRSGNLQANHSQKVTVAVSASAAGDKAQTAHQRRSEHENWRDSQKFDRAVGRYRNK